MDGNGTSRSFPLPSQIADVPGAEGWRSMYQYFTRFQPEDDNRFWFNNAMHFPEPLPAFDVLTCEIPYGAIGANTSRVFCFPTTDDELRRLARLAVDCGVDDLFADGCSPAEVLQALTERGEAGERWLAGFDKARDPWFNVSTGDGFYHHHHRSWNDDLTVPFAALPRYVRLKSAVTNRPVTGSDLPWWQG